MAPAATVIVPARLASTRLPEKVLLARTGRPLVQHVVDAARAAPGVGRVVVAVDHARIARALRPFGTECVLTDASHPNGTSRLAQAAQLLGLGEDDPVVNAQGDEPELPAAVIGAALGALLGSRWASIGTVASPISDPRQAHDPNVVKVARAPDGRALYFSRAPIPHDRDAAGPPTGPAAAHPCLRHIGVYAYRAGFLRAYAAMEPTPLETTEKLEQLRALERGHAIAVALAEAPHTGIDTAEQYEAFVARLGGPAAAR
ncbi:MAG: 3-deoxy-manno-octulosonate cytidylyltransferase [Planctomyces sp.]|nr:3-deoxy-manno-octulosonate cytidylyltransferase [Planctomyces sp.]MBA4119390.1 3-deoxy-manno-octulosonate cytidylyltransferase [Isosphaera sp.]